jgi:hypothetical protein
VPCPPEHRGEGLDGERWEGHDLHSPIVGAGTQELIRKEPVIVLVLNKHKEDVHGWRGSSGVWCARSSERRGS